MISPSPVNRPVGVFDSGIGGLSVLQAVQQELPHEQFIYVADSGHAPYGERDDDYVLARSRTIADHLITQHSIKALVVACNTATAAAIHVLRAHYPALPIIGVEPALKPAAESTQTGVVGVMATRGTLSSEKFRSLLDRMHGKATFVLQPCDGLADAIEHDDRDRIDALSAQYTRAMGAFGNAPGSMDTLVLGCTHYPFVANTLLRNVGPKVQLLEAGAPVARQTRRMLELGGILAPALDGALADNPRGLEERVQFFSSGNVLELQAAVERWLHFSAKADVLVC